MRPVIYAADANDFTTLGITTLSDVTSCVVTEERNGEYECIFTYPISGAHYDEILAERIIKTTAHPIGDPQLFRIYRISKPIHGIVTVYCQHISYDLSGIALNPFTGSYTATGAMAYMFTDTPFTGHSDKSGSKTVTAETPKSVRSMLGGTEGSLLDLWGGEYRWDNFDVYLNVNRGNDADVVIEYGKNLTQLVADHDLTDVYSELLPYATYQDDTGSHTVVGTPQPITSVITRQKTLIKEFPFDSQPTVAQVDAAAQAWLTDNPLGYETPSLNVSFVDIPHGDDYPDARIDLCDTVTIRYTALGVDVKAKVVRTEYDSLLERYTKLTVGKPRANMATSVAAIESTVEEVQTYPTRWSNAIQVATQLITGNAGGYVVLHEGQDGQPYELLVMDSPDISSAQNVWRWNVNGLGFSSAGYAGPYATAITSTGQINADFIATGEINADLIKTGTLIIKDSSNNTLFEADADAKTVTIGGFTVTADKLTNTSGTTTVDIGANGSFKVAKGNSLAYIAADSLGVSTSDRFVEIINDGGGTRLWAYSSNGVSRVEPGTVSATDSAGENSTTIYPTGVVFDDDAGHATTLTAWGYSLQAAGTMNITLKAGMYLAIVTRAGSSETAQTGLYVIQAYSTNSTIKEISSATASTLSVSGLNLTWTTTNSLRALRLIRLS